MMIVLATDAVANISWRNPQITLNYERTLAFQGIVALRQPGAHVDDRTRCPTGSSPSQNDRR